MGLILLFVLLPLAVSVAWNWWRGKEMNASNILKVGAVTFLVCFVLVFGTLVYLTYATYTSFRH